MGRFASAKKERRKLPALRRWRFCSFGPTREGFPLPEGSTRFVAAGTSTFRYERRPLPVDLRLVRPLLALRRPPRSTSFAFATLFANSGPSAILANSSLSRLRFAG